MNSLSKRLAALTPEKREMFLRQTQMKQEGKQAQILPQLRSSEGVPLSFAQQRLWFLNQLEPHSPSYNMFSAFRLQGKLHIEALEWSLAALVQRHEVLRTTFHMEEDRPVQIIDPVVQIQCPLIDISDIAVSTRENHALSIIEQEALHPFNLSIGPLMRVYLLRLSEQEHVLILTMHHIISDGWSMSVLINDLTAFYRARIKGKHESLPVLPIQYADYALWQRQWLQGQILQEQMEYWRHQLADTPAFLHLPADHPRPAVQTFVGARQSQALSKELTQQLNTLSRQENATLFMTLLASLQVLLMRYSGQQDIVIGTPIANRMRPEVSSLIGFFVNTLVLRTDLSGNPGFTELLARVREVTMQAYAHQDFPFERLLETLHVERTLNYTPLFQILFALQNMPRAVMPLDELTLQPLAIEQKTTKFDLSIVTSETEQGLLIIAEYNTDLFEASTIQRLLTHWQMLLQGIVTNPTCSLGNLPLLTAAEQHMLLVRWNETERERVQVQSLQRLFEAQEQQTPDAIAIIFEQLQITYMELNQRANQLAHALQRRGVQGEERIGVYMERSPELVIAVLGILKAGAVYVPLDTTAPSERLLWMVEDFHPAVILCQQQLQPTQFFPNEQVLYLDTDWTNVIASESTTNLVENIAEEQLAYIIYTSGSTGRPKGVMVSHRAICNSLLWMQEAFHLQPGDSLMQRTSLNFDASLWELVWPLLCGARIVLAAPRRHVESEYICATMLEQNVSIAFFVPSFLSILLDEADLRRCKHLRQILCGGEVLPVELIQRFFVNHAAQLANLYGPTEAAIQVTSWQVKRAMVTQTIPIGLPIANTKLYLLDRYGMPVPPGVVGELFIGGSNLARGYLGHPELTAMCFIPDHFGQIPGACLYRTGDLARYRKDGALEYVGRTDDQVKLHGVRIEPGEIQETLNRHPAVQESLVLVTTEVAGRPQLVAYLRLKQSEDQVGNALPSDICEMVRYWASEVLPPYMVPTYYQSLNAWPLSPSGKIDRKSLPPVNENQRASTEVSGIPTTRNERLLADLWCKALGREQVNIHDNFFMLGGDSIVSIQIVARARQAGLQLTPKQLFQYQTIAQLAVVIDSSEEVVEEQEAQPGLVPLTPIQQWFFERELPEPQHFNQAVLLQLPSNWTIQRLQQVVQMLYARHDVLRYRYKHSTQGWQQCLLAVAEVERVLVELMDLSTVPPETQRQVLEEYAQRVQESLDIQVGPLWRVIYFQLREGQAARLLIVMHHLLIDGVSWRILLEELHLAMNQLEQRLPIQLPARTVPFQRWAQSLLTIANSKMVQQERDYWLEVVRHPAVAFPLDGSQRERQMPTRTRTLSSVLSQQETQALLHEALLPYHSQVQELLLCALAQVLTRWTGSRHMRLALEGHGREEIGEQPLDLSRTLGWFTSLYPVLLTAPEQQEMSAWIKAIKEQLRAIPGKGIGYGLLRYLSEEPELVEQLRSASPAQISFNYLGQFDQMVQSDAASQHMLQLAPESSGDTHAAANPRPHPLEINILIAGGQLRLNWTYSEHSCEQETMEQIVEAYLQSLRQIIAHCLSPLVGGYTPADFPLARLSQQQLDQLVKGQRDIDDIYPLTPMQQGMLFHSLYAPDSGVYVEQICGTFYNLDQHIFVQAWQHIIAQTAILRTSFVWQDLEEPLQLVNAQAILPVHVLDWRDRSSEQQIETEAFLQDDRRRGFDLQQAPLMRLTLIMISETKTLVIWSHHHLLLDGWSMGILLQDVLACYNGLLRNETVYVEQRRPYRDYVSWLQKQERSQLERYWRHYLAGFSTAIPLGIDQRKEDTGVRQYEYAIEKIILSESTSLRLQEAARRRKITLNTLIQGAWALVLARYSGQQDVVFGTVVAGRPPELSGIERMLGLFINTLPVRIMVHDDEYINDWLHHLQEQQVEVRQYEYTPLVQLQQWSAAPHDQPLFESLLVFENYPVEAGTGEQSSQLQLEAMQVRTQTNYPLTLAVSDSAELHLRMSYQSQRFERTAIARLLVHISNVLDQLTEPGEQKLRDISLLTPQERQQQLVNWNRTQRNYTYEPLTRLFEIHAARTPDAVAVVFEEHMLTYAELNERANQLAYALIKRGIGPERRVALLLERSLELLIAILGVLKTGGAYIPLDPTLPLERLGWMLQDARPALVLSLTSLLSLLSLPSEQLFLIDREWGVLADELETNFALVLNPHSLAYVLYTSGSTGKSKGVAIEQCNLLNYILAVSELAGLQQPGYFALLQPLNVDSSITMLFPSLIFGGVLHLISKELALDAYALMQLFRRIPPDHLKIAPSHLAALGQIVGLEPLMPRRSLIVGGEESQRGWAQDIARALPEGAKLFNHYGPTETTVGSAMYHVERQEYSDVYVSTTPLGQALANTQLYVLDKDLRPLPIEVTGELYIGGMGVARGYLDRADLTASQFIPDPFASEPGQRLYRTGDLVRAQADSTLIFIGRSDEQVKIRGNRIEPAEIETVLAGHAGLHDAVVLAIEAPGGGKRLVAYVVSKEPGTVSTRDIQQWVRAKLPEVMVPGEVKWLEALPLTPHGKVDRNALRRLPLNEEVHFQEGEAPRSETEERVAQIWRQVLTPGSATLSIHDNFFDLGGHSLLIMQVISRIRSEFALDLPLRSLFESPTIAQLGQVIEQQQQALLEQKTQKELLSMLDTLEGLSEEELYAILQQEDEKG